MKKSVLLLLLMMIGLSSEEHPSWGIVVDENGVIYFVDVMHHDGTLWQYNPQSGDLKALVKDHFHAHCLQMENDQLMIPTQIWIDGVIMGDGQNYMFTYDLNSHTLDTVMKSTSYEKYAGGNATMNVHDNEVYYAHKNQIYAVDVASGKRRLLLEHTFERISTMNYDENGCLWITDSYADGGSLWKWSASDKLIQVTKNLIPEHPTALPFKEKNHHLLYGIGFSEKGNPVICESADRQVKEVLPSGKTRVVYQSPEHFFPVGVHYFDRKYYVMEIGYVQGEGHVGPYIVTVAGGKFIRDKIQYD